jgi:hypothetical protein
VLAGTSRRVTPALRGVATVVGALLIVSVAGCGSSTTSATGGSPTFAKGTRITAGQMEKFVGNGVKYWDHGSFGFDLTTLVAEAGAPGGNLLRVTYPAGSASKRAGGEDGGAQAYLKLGGGPVDELYLQYQVRFQPGFDFVKGGKLPGLFGGTVNNGQNIPDGTNGFSTRYMWRADGDGEVYAYLPTSQEHGTSLGRGCWRFVPGEWTTIQQRVKLNTPGAANGEIVVWQDGKQVLTKTDLTFRSTDQLKIDGLFFSTFFGGGDSSWATPVDQYADFAGFVISEKPIPVAGQPVAAEGDAADCGVPVP